MSISKVFIKSFCFDV